MSSGEGDGGLGIDMGIALNADGDEGEVVGEGFAGAVAIDGVQNRLEQIVRAGMRPEAALQPLDTQLLAM